MNINKPEDIAEIKIIRSSTNSTESEVNDLLDEGWELVAILPVESKLVIVVGRREEEDETQDAQENDSTSIPVGMPDHND